MMQICRTRLGYGGDYAPGCVGDSFHFVAVFRCGGVVIKTYSVVAE
jgi:hypothetical protein